MTTSESLPSIIVNSNTIDLAISVWLDAKEHKSGSQRTRKLYERTITNFRALLRSVGYDLDPDSNIAGEITEQSRRNACREIALAAQGFAAMSASEKPVSEATYNNRLAILSSFYEFAKWRDFFTADNPLRKVERASVQLYKDVQPLDANEVKRRLKLIDRSDPMGARDYAMLAIFFQTGRRLAEVVNLHWRDVQIQGEKMTLTFHCKGNKTMMDTMPPGVSKSVIAWLEKAYGSLELLPETPLWISFTRRSQSRIGLTMRSVPNILRKHLGVSKVHITRHTWARQMEEQGAKVSEIQARLGHESLATTGRYLFALSRAENAHAGAIEKAFGLDE